MQRVIYTLVENTPLAPGVCRMVLSGDTSQIRRPGQFVDLALPSRFLRRPISVCDWTADRLTLVYRVVGAGTAQMAALKPGDTLEALSGLGSGYDVDACPDDALLVGGGIGIPPLYGLAKRLVEAGKHPRAILGFNKAEEIFYEKAFAALCIPVTIATADGSAGVRGFVTDALPRGGYVCCCGPLPMLKAVWKMAAAGQYSFEARMGCGYGACMGCTLLTAEGPKRVCKEGPVFRHEIIVWPD